jgi:hypothetical protein
VSGLAPPLAAADLDLPWAEAEACHARWLQQLGDDDFLSIAQREGQALARLEATLWNPGYAGDVNDLLRLVAGIGLTRTRQMRLDPSSTLLCVYVARDPTYHASGVVGALPIGPGQHGTAAEHSCALLERPLCAEPCVKGRPDQSGHHCHR